MSKNKNKQIGYNSDKSVRLKNIENLYNALRTAGVWAEINWDAKWYCSDGKTHYGIEIIFNSGSYDEESFCFTPDGLLIYNCTKAPTEKE